VIVTTLDRVMNAIRFVQQQTGSLWFVLGQITPWTTPYSDISPPADSPTATGVNSPVCAMLATPTWVYEDDVGGAISFIDANGNTRKFTQVSSESTAIADGITQVLIQTTTPGSLISALGVSTFRQVGLYSNLVPAGGHGSDTFLAAANITNFGVLEAIESSVPQPIISTDTYEMNFILSF